jgi:hypothetical protein
MKVSVRLSHYGRNRIYGYKVPYTITPKNRVNEIIGISPLARLHALDRGPDKKQPIIETAERN